MHPEHTTKKLISYHLSHNNYRSIELRHSSHQIDSLALTQASVNQLPGSSDVHNRAVSVSSSVSDNCRRSQDLKSSSINCPEWRRRRYVVESECEDRVKLILSSAFWSTSIFFHRKTVGLDKIETLSVFSICVDVPPQKSEKLTHQLVVPRY